MMDNLDAHVEGGAAVRAAGAFPWFGPANATWLWQPVDRGYGSTFKHLYVRALGDWLAEKPSDGGVSNADRWESTRPCAPEGEPTSLTPTEKRVLVGTLADRAWAELAGDKYAAPRKKILGRTGPLVTVDGTGDELIEWRGRQIHVGPSPTTKPPEPLPAPAEPGAEPEDVQRLEDDQLDADPDAPFPPVSDEQPPSIRPKKRSLEEALDGTDWLSGPPSKLATGQMVAIHTDVGWERCQVVKVWAGNRAENAIAGMPEESSDGIRNLDSGDSVCEFRLSDRQPSVFRASKTRAFLLACSEGIF